MHCIRFGEIAVNNAACMSWNLTFYLVFSCKWLLWPLAQSSSDCATVDGENLHRGCPSNAFPANKKKSKGENEGGSSFLHFLVLNDVIILSRSQTTLVESARACDTQQITFHWAIFHFLWIISEIHCSIMSLGFFHLFINTVVIYIFSRLKTIRRWSVNMSGRQLPNLSLFGFVKTVCRICTLYYRIS